MGSQLAIVSDFNGIFAELLECLQVGIRLSCFRRGTGTQARDHAVRVPGGGGAQPITEGISSKFSNVTVFGSPMRERKRIIGPTYGAGSAHHLCRPQCGASAPGTADSRARCGLPDVAAPPA